MPLASNVVVAGSASFWGFVTNGTNLCTGLFTVVAVAYALTPSQIGIWFILSALGNVGLAIAMGGIAPTTQRFASYLHAGAVQLVPFGVPDTTSSNEENLAGLRTLRAATATLLHRVAPWVSIFLIALGFAILQHNSIDYCLDPRAWLAVIVQSIAVWIQIIAAGDVAIAQGSGGMAAMQRGLAIARVVYAAALLGGLFFGLGLCSLGVAGIIAGAMQWILAKLALRRLGTGAAPPMREISGFIRCLWPTTWRLSTVSVGSWLINTSAIVMAGFLLSLNEAGKYGMSLQLLNACTSFAGVWISMAIPTICKLRATGSKRELRFFVMQRVRLALATYLACAACVIIAAPSLLSWLGRSNVLPSLWLLAALALVLLLEFHHGTIWASILMTNNEVPFLGAALISGVGVLCVGFMLVVHADIGAWGFVLGQGLVQAAYNNWKWPLKGYRTLAGGES